MNLPLMVIAFGLMVGIPLWFVLRRPEWHGKRHPHTVPAYLSRSTGPVLAVLPVPRPFAYDGERELEPVGARRDG
jgi:hypothetical protein